MGECKFKVGDIVWLREKLERFDPINHQPSIIKRRGLGPFQVSRVYRGHREGDWLVSVEEHSTSYFEERYRPDSPDAPRPMDGDMFDEIHACQDAYSEIAK